MGQASDYPLGFGPQGDAIRIMNYVRLVRGGVAVPVEGDQDPAPESARGPGPGRAPDQGGGGPLQGPGQSQGPGDRRGPPAEAISACLGHSEGDSVTFTSPRGDPVQGICRERDGELFAVPQGR
jgi:hypothetical protein